MNKKVYLTTPIYYPNDNLHIGHTYTNIATDTISRHYKQRGYDVFFTTGNDEHGEKIQNTAENKGITPQEHVDVMASKSIELWKSLDIDYDYFARTTSDKHERIVKKVWKKLQDNDDIYKGEYEGWYCVSDETFLNDTEVTDGVCNICGKNVEKIKEESYFFRMSKYSSWIKEYYNDNPDFILPRRVQNELLSNFINDGLKDLSISRTSFSWGIKVPNDEKHVMYVWIDALFNYLTSLNYLEDNDTTHEYWNNNAIHIVGKEITRFHGIYWPIFLHSLGINQPRKIFAHGWLLMKDGKMSKSKGNVIRPNIIIDRYGPDSLRYFLLREIPFGSDGKFTPESFISRYNSDLVNDLSNLVHRTISMANKYLNGIVRKPKEFSNSHSNDLYLKVKNVKDSVEKSFENFEINIVLEKVWSLISSTNKYIDLTKPWSVSKEDSVFTEEILYVLLSSINDISKFIYSFMPGTAKKIKEALNTPYLYEWKGISIWENESFELNKKEAIFSRLNVEEEIEYFDYELKKKTLI